MADLRSLINTVVAPAATSYPQEVLIYNTSINSQNNGGRCCLWTVPAGTTWVTFEVWGGGGGGGGACCCQQGWPGGSGAYTIKTVCSSTLAGCQYTVCAGSTTQMSINCQGCPGCDSWVTGYGLSNLCARGGAYGETHCSYGAGSYNCSTPNPYCCCAFGGDLNIHGNQSSYTNSQWCFQAHQMQAAVAPNTVSGPQYGPGGCINGSSNGSCTGWFPCSVFPGGGGMSAQAHGQNCWCGTWGGGGLVSITYG